MDLIMLAMVILGMWGAFFLGSRRDREKMVEFGKTYQPEPMDYPEDVTDEEYIKLIRNVAEENAEIVKTD